MFEGKVLLSEEIEGINDEFRGLVSELIFCLRYAHWLAFKGLFNFLLSRGREAVVGPLNP